MKHVLLVPDVEGWAWWHMAKGLQRCAPSGIDCHVMSQSQFGVMTKDLRFLTSHFDAIVQFSWVEASHPGRGMEFRRHCTVLASHGAEYPYPIESGSVAAQIATRLRNRENAEKSLPKFDAVLCVSQRLRDVAESVGANAALTLPGVDEVFRQQSFCNDPHITIGWCGQPGQTKGFHEILKPLAQRSPNFVRYVINDRSASNPLNQSEMVEWYRDIDVLLSTSCSEGFQMPPLEAMACGRAVIATDCGGIPHLMEKRNGWMVPGWEYPADCEQTVDNLLSVVKSLSHREVQRRGDAAANTVKQRFLWKHRAKDWFDAALG